MKILKILIDMLSIPLFFILLIVLWLYAPFWIIADRRKR